MGLLKKIKIALLICAGGLAWPLSLSAQDDHLAQDNLTKLKAMNQKLDEMEYRLGIKGLSQEQSAKDKNITEALAKPGIETQQEPAIEKKIESEPVDPAILVEDGSALRLKLLDSQAKNQVLARQAGLLEDKVKESEFVIDGLQKQLVSINIELEKEKASRAGIEAANKNTSQAELLSRIKDLENRLSMALRLNYHLYCRIGEVCLRLKMYKESLWAYSRATAFPGVDPRVYYYTGLLYQYSGDQPDKAAVYLQKYLKQDPDGDYARGAREILDVLGIKETPH